jgi:hypothetical protein
MGNNVDDSPEQLHMKKKKEGENILNGIKHSGCHLKIINEVGSRKNQSQNYTRV